MKNKTATLLVYTPWGTSGCNRIVDVLYRNKVLYSFYGDTEQKLIDKARVWALNRNYTGVKIEPQTKSEAEVRKIAVGFDISLGT
jgi:hypothetical protein